MQRRGFLAGGAAAASAAGLSAPAIAQAKQEWRMVMPWPRNTPGLGTNAQTFADRVTQMSDGRLTVKLFAGGELVPPFESLDAVQSGAAELCHSTPYYWVGKAPALNYFTTIPFGLTATELAGWIYHGGAQALWDEVYAPLGVKPFYAGNSGVQAGGWFRKEINGLDDLKGLKFRIAGLGGEVMRRLGVNVVLLPPGEISPALLNGTVDAAEWVGPWNDRAFGLYKVAKFYYVPAFHEPGPGLEVLVSRERYEELTPDLQKIIEVAASAAASETLADFNYHNITSLDPLLDEHEVELRHFPDDVIKALGATTKEVLAELSGENELIGRVHASFIDYLGKARRYSNEFEQRLYAMRALAEIDG